jgi:hypothetical protein
MFGAKTTGISRLRRRWRLAIGFETGGADDHADTGLAAEFEMFQRALRTGEIDQAIDMLEAGRHIVGNQ